MLGTFANNLEAELPSEKHYVMLGLNSLPVMLWLTQREAEKQASHWGFWSLRV